MNSELGVFALRQIVSSMVVLGPLIVITGAFSYVFNQNRRAVLAYVLVGIFLTAVGGINLYLELGSREPEQEIAREKE